MLLAQIRHFFDQDVSKVIFASVVGGGTSVIKTENVIMGWLQIGIAVLTFIYLAVKLYRYVKYPSTKQRTGKE